MEQSSDAVVEGLLWWFVKGSRESLTGGGQYHKAYSWTSRANFDGRQFQQTDVKPDGLHRSRTLGCRGPQSQINRGDGFVGRRSLTWEESVALRDQIEAEYDRELVTIETYGAGFIVVVASKQASRPMERVTTIEAARDYLKLVRHWAQMPEPDETGLEEASKDLEGSEVPEAVREPVF